MAKKRFLLPSEGAAVQGYSTDESAKMLTLFWYEVGKHMLQNFLRYSSKWKDVSYVKGNIVSISKLNGWVVTMVHCLVEKRKRGGHHQKEHADKYGRMLDTTTKQLVGSLRNFLSR